MPPVTHSAAALFAPIQHPALKSVDPQKVSTFLREWELYLDEVAKKQKEVPSMTSASFKVSVDGGLLKTMHALGKLSSVAPEVAFKDLNSKMIEGYVRSIFERVDEQISPVIISEALKGQ